MPMTGCAGQPNTKLLLEGHAGCHHAINGECHAHTHTPTHRFYVQAAALQLGAVV